MNKYFSFLHLLFIAGFLILVSCKKDVTGPVDDPSTLPANFYADSVQPIFTTNCVGCHSGEFGPNELGLDSGKSYNMLINVKSPVDTAYVRVKPGSPQESLLYSKVASDTPLGTGSGMPAGFALINYDSAAVNIIYRWIAAGAPED